MSAPFLEVSGLSKRFGGLLAVNEVSFQAEQNRITAIIGPNGAGKTTLFNLITGCLAPNEGAIRFNGREITSIAPFQIAQAGIVRTFQLVRLFGEMTVAENMMVGFHARTRGNVWAAIARPQWVREQTRRIRQEAGALLERLGLASQADTLASNLTYGQQRLLEVARALAAQPRLLMLDEPAAGLNHMETTALSSLIGSIRDGGTTVLFIEHDMNMVMNTAEKVVVLDFGRKIAEGSPAEVQKNPHVLEAYLG